MARTAAVASRGTSAGTRPLPPLSYTMGLPPSPSPVVRQFNRNIVIGGGVLLFHVAALWALQSGLLRRAVEVVVPVAILSDIVVPPAPKAEPAPSVEPKPPEPPKQRPVARKAERTPPPAPQPVAVPAPPAPELLTGVEVMMPPPPVGPPVAVAPAPPVAPAPAKVELPSSSADYLQNPAPSYPPISKRLGEQGKVLVRVLIGPDGMPQKAELKHSSGFERLDRSALEYVMRCRYVPGKVGGVPQAMWHEAPVNFVLE
jgi:protein TonB